MFQYDRAPGSNAIVHFWWERQTGMSVKTDDREEKIMRLLLQRGAATIEEMLATPDPSAPSTRRDLNRLERRGLVRRPPGGATLGDPLLYEPFRYDTSFQA